MSQFFQTVLISLSVSTTLALLLSYFLNANKRKTQESEIETPYFILDTESDECFEDETDLKQDTIERVLDNPLTPEWMILYLATESEDEATCMKALCHQRVSKRTLEDLATKGSEVVSKSAKFALNVRFDNAS